jgi:hypothetical protein
MIRNRRFATVAVSAVAAATFGLAAVAGAATASAGNADDAFLKNIAAENISFDSAKGAISDAHLVCEYLADGKTGTDIGGEIMDNSDLNAHQAAVFVVEAAYAYCPGSIGHLS